MLVKNNIELIKALNNNEKEIQINNAIFVDHPIHLHPEQKLIGLSENATLYFISSDGVGLSKNNEVKNLNIQIRQDKKAIFLINNAEDLGHMHLENINTTGVVHLLMRAPTKKLNVYLNKVHIHTADATGFHERPMKYGVVVHQGALTLYNYNSAPDSLLTVEAENISIGSKFNPVIGTGVFISGFNDELGPVEVKKLTTGPVYSNGLIPFGQPNLITGAIFILQNVHVDLIENKKEVVTYGTNDMVLDAWGKVDKWIAHENIISYGPSGIGFVNFGEVNYFEAKKEIITYGLGARGFNQYDGTIKEAIFNGITTYGDGGVGMQFSKPVGKITVNNKVETNGGTGETLVKGVIMILNADAISLLNGSMIDELIINAKLSVKSDQAHTLKIDAGATVKQLDLKDKSFLDDKKDILISDQAILPVDAKKLLK